LMDKTGTLTRGTLSVGKVDVSEDWKDRGTTLAVLICAAEEEAISAHPLALAVFRKFLPLAGDSWQNYKSAGGVRDLDWIGGRGVRCKINSGDGVWRKVCIGNIASMLEENIEGVATRHEQVGNEGTAVFVSIDDEIAASLVLQVGRFALSRNTVLTLYRTC